jgi:two-component system, chemotaxis family, CheB/CheR fusion protein
MKQKKEASEKTKPASSFPLVAIGASAGGLEAVTQLIKNLPSNTGMAFIYVPHLSPDYKSMLSSLLSKSTKMKVQEAKDGEKMEPNNFFIIPPNKEMSVTDGHIKLTPRKNRRLANTPIDVFFSSLAEKHKDSVIGILLSGGGTDGTKGLKRIKEEGGLTFAQDSSAKFPFMPEAAIAQGVVDSILSPKEIALALVRFSKSDYSKNKVAKTTKEDEIENKHPDLKVILQLLFHRKGMDFSHYKMNTIKRRIIRRTQIHNIKTLKEYIEFLRKKPEEVELLSQDLLINVTSFFREPDRFAFLRSTLFPKLLKTKKPGETLRLWVPACSTGEEVYSIAMILLELQEKRLDKLTVQIFATDLSEYVIRKARIGEYSEDELDPVSLKLKSKYFVKTKEGYRAGKLLRESCMFAQHNILYDPPFSNVDFISCCNLLIYLDTAAQKKVISTFHYALKENGYLMLSKSETVGTSVQLFSVANKKYKIYKRKKHPGARIIPSITPRFAQNSLPVKNQSFSTSTHMPLNTGGHLGTLIDGILLARYTPACVVINHDLEILEVRGATNNYLRLPAGKVSLNILKMAQPELAFELRSAIHNAIRSDQTIRKTEVEIKQDPETRIVTLEITPLKIEGEEPLLLILFSEQQRVDIYHPADKEGKNNYLKTRIKRLEEELLATRADMLAITHDHESTIEELQSANEEVVSNNEELRTLNEELETSKEEIESTNEELLNANQKLQMHSEKVEELNKYSEMILATIHNPMLVLDMEFRIRSSNKPFSKQFHISEGVEGKKLFTINNNQWRIPKLQKLLLELISKNTFLHNVELTHTFKDLGEKVMLVNARLVKRKSDNDQLILLVIEDITERANLHKNERKLIYELQEANKSLENMNEELKAFNYISSHDLQEPLRKINTFASYILNEERKNLSENGKDYFKRMVGAVNQMQTLIEDLLSYSKISVKDRKFVKTDIDKVITSVTKDFSEIIKEKNVRVETGELDEIKVIAFQFRQLMHNLIGNALKYSSNKRRPHIFIKSKIVKGSRLGIKDALREQPYCHISVKDNGIGFDPKYKDLIFGVFERLHEGKKYDGNGIGLAICKKIVQNHNGFISASSREGKGTTFDIYLPVLK